MKNILKRWWQNLIWEPGDPKLMAGSRIKIAAIGGGTGLSTLLAGLKYYSSDISAIVAVTDDGRSSGKLKTEFDVLPPGDIRKCISALTYDEKLTSQILEYRFDKKSKELSGHTLGNIWITALTKELKSFAKAIEVSSELFRTAGRIYPATLSKVDIGADYGWGKQIIGESKIPQAGRKIAQVFLTKKNIRAYPKATIAISKADLIIIGPGSLYTSIVPNLLIKGIRESIKKNKSAVKVYVMNCSTERGETEGYGVKEHIETIFNHAGRVFDVVLVNSKIILKSKEYSEIGKIHNISTNEQQINKCRIFKENIIDSKKPLYHDKQRLAAALIKIYRDYRK